MLNGATDFGIIYKTNKKPCVFVLLDPKVFRSGPAVINVSPESCGPYTPKTLMQHQVRGGVQRMQDCLAAAQGGLQSPR